VVNASDHDFPENGKLMTGDYTISCGQLVPVSLAVVILIHCLPRPEPLPLATACRPAIFPLWPVPAENRRASAGTLFKDL
jgi:hypothetical protein